MFQCFTFLRCFIIRWLLVFFLKLPEMTTSSSSSELIKPGTGRAAFWSDSLGWEGLGVGRYLGIEGRVRKIGSSGLPGHITWYWSPRSNFSAPSLAWRCWSLSLLTEWGRCNTVIIIREDGGATAPCFPQIIVNIKQNQKGYFSPC